MSAWNVISLQDVTASPWRNGGGVTRELAVWPARENWVWRMSVAEVDRSGPFSKFDGVDRWFAVLDGAGVRLDVAGIAYPLTPADAPFFFDGAAPVECCLLAGKTQDFNLMVRRSSASAQMQRVTGRFEKLVDATKIVAIYIEDTRSSVLFNLEGMNFSAASLVWRQVDTPTLVTFTGGNALWMEIRV